MSQRTPPRARPRCATGGRRSSAPLPRRPTPRPPRLGQGGEPAPALSAPARELGLGPRAGRLRAAPPTPSSRETSLPTEETPGPLRTKGSTRTPWVYQLPTLTPSFRDPRR